MRRRRKRDIIIELTSLLDVIMILIFMVMNENSKLIADQQDLLDTVQEENAEQAKQIDRLSDELDEAQSKLDEGNLEEIIAALKDAESRLDAYEAINADILIVNVSLENNNNNTIRYLTYGKSTEISTRTSSRSDDQFSKSVNQLKVFLSEAIQQFLNSNTNSDAIVYVIFSYNPDKIYQRDFRAIDQALQGFETTVSIENFRYRKNPIFNES